MIASWMAFAALVSAVLTIGGVALEPLAHARGWPRRAVWLTVLVGSVAWPALSALKHLLPTRAPVLPFAITVLPAQVVVASSGPDRALLINRGLMVFWVIASLVLLARLGRGMWRLRHTRAAWRRGEIDGTAVRLSPNVGPAVVGLRSMEVVLPEWIVSLDASLRALVLCHEEEHRQKRDPYLLFAAAVAVVLMPWNLALWFQARRLRLAIEMDCDARVLRAHPTPERYGLLMLTIAQRKSIVPVMFAPMLSEPTTNLERRIIAMRDSTRRLTRVGIYGAAITTVGALAFACTLQSDSPTSPTKSAAPTRMTGAQTYFEFQVEKTAAPVPGGPAPRYPDMLRSANVEGEVLAQFVVNTDSSPDMATFKVLRTTHDLFTAAVRANLANTKFSPALVGGRAVKQVVQMPFTFSLSKSVTVGPALVAQPEAPISRAPRAQVRPGPEYRGKQVPRQVKDDDVLFEFQVEKAVSPRPSNPSPRYPDMLRTANVEGEVLAQFVVDKNGRAEMGTFKILKSSHDLFSNAVEAALPQMQFYSAEVGGRPMRQLVQMPFQFSLTKR
jgi:TonB family protein